MRSPLPTLAAICALAALLGYGVKHGKTVEKRRDRMIQAADIAGEAGLLPLLPPSKVVECSAGLGPGPGPDQVQFHVTNISGQALEYWEDSQPAYWETRLQSGGWSEKQGSVLCGNAMNKATLPPGRSLTITAWVGHLPYRSRFGMLFNDPDGKRVEVWLGEHVP